MAQSCSPRSRTVTPGSSAEPRAQAGGERGVALGDGVDAPAERVVDRHAQADLGGGVALPHLEATGVAADLVAIGRHPAGGVQVEHHRFDAGDQLGVHPEEPRAPWAPQELPAVPGEDPAPELLHVERELAGRLAGVEHEQHAGLAGTGARPPPPGSPARSGWGRGPATPWRSRPRRAPARAPRGPICPCSSSSTSTSWQPVRCLQLEERDGVGAVLGPADQHPVAAVRAAASTRPCPTPGWPSRAARSGRAPRRSARPAPRRCAASAVGGLGGGLVATGVRLALRGGRPPRRAPAGGAARRRRG